MNMLRTLLGTTALLLLFSCATTIPVKVRKPAEFNVGAIRTLAVSDFQFKGNWDFSADEKPGSAAAKKLQRALMKKRKGELNPYKAYPGATVSDKLTAKLVDNGYYTVVERKKLETLLKEQSLSLSGLVEPEQALEVGRMIGAGGLLTGSGSYSVKDIGAWEEYTETKKNKKGEKIKVTKKRYRISRFVQAELTYRLIDLSTGKILVSKSNRLANYSAGGLKGIDRKGYYTATGKDEHSASAGLPDWHGIVDKLVDALNQKCVTQIAPHTVTEKRKIAEGKSEAMEKAVKLVKRDLWEDARRIWENTLQNPPSEEDKLAALYNLGVYAEVFGFLDQAGQKYKQCFELSGDEDYLDDLARVRKRKKELQRLRAQEL